MLARKALAGTAGAPKLYVEDVFSTYLYTGTAASNTISNSIDLSGEGGLLWIKNRGDGGQSHVLIDSARGTTKALCTSATAAEETLSGGSVTFNNNGFNISAGVFSGEGNTNANTNTYASWTFRKAEKFFDVVTYTGDGTQARAINHSLGSTPGCIIVKCYSTGGTTWFVWHRSINGGNGRLKLASTDAATSPDDGAVWGNSSTSTYVAPTSTTFTVSSNISVNNSGDTYVAYLFAHDAGGFGDAGSDSIIKCGSFTATSGTFTDLGWEPQWLLVKNITAENSWSIVDNMRGVATGENDNYLLANTSGAEVSNSDVFDFNAKGFTVKFTSATDTYIYIAIRRGPMKTPTTGTSVYTPDAGTNGTNGGIVTTNFPVDLAMTAYRSLGGVAITNDRLRGFGIANSAGVTPALITSGTDSESSYSGSNPYFYNAWNTTITRGSNGANPGGAGIITWFFRRAPGFFDVVCYTGTGSATTVSHNLGVAPELVILKRRNSAEDWPVLQTNIPTQATLNGTFSGDPPNSSYFGNGTSYVAPTSTVFSVGTNSAVNASGGTYVAYLFASLSGVSKVGSYTGNGSSVTVTTDFQPRFILVKRTDSTGNWIVGDSARGLVSADEPALFLNSTAAETTGQDWVDVSSTGFTVNETALNANVNTATYIYLCVA